MGLVPLLWGLSALCLKSMNYRFLRHKHGRKHLIQYTVRFGATASLLTAMLFPTPALGFMGALALTASPTILAQVDNTLDSFSLLQAKVANPLSTEGFATQAMWATSSPVTTEAQWEEKVAPQPVSVAKVERIKPTLQNPVVLEGEASYYSRAGCLGCDPMMIMANGQSLDDNALTMAIGADKKHLVGYKAKVTSLATGKSVIVRITDTGGFYQAKYGHRVADLTIATKQAIGMRGGVGQVRVEIF